MDFVSRVKIDVTDSVDNQVRNSNSGRRIKQKFSILSLKNKEKSDSQTNNSQKKLKLSPRKSKIPLDTNTNASTILTDTFDNVNITGVIENVQITTKIQHDTVLTDSFDNFSFTNVEKTTNKPEFDAFAQYFNENEAKNVELPLKETQEWFAESFNTQIMNQIESFVPSDGENENEDDKNEKIIDRTQLFENVEVTNQYRREVDNLFEKIEQSIMGAESFVADEILDVIFSDDVENNDDKSQNAVNLNIDWTNDTLMNASFGSVIKQALINNATKAVQPFKVSNTQNVTVVDRKPHFRNLGPFYGLPLRVKELVKQFKGIQELYDWQDECLKLPAVENRKNLIYALPTSGGKTLVAEILMLREILCYQRNAIFILPYVAIVQEKVWDLSSFGVALDFLVEEYASSKGVYPPRKRRRKHSVYVCTIEKALGLINSLIETGRLDEIGLVVVDELHLIGEEGRGATLEACLAKILFLKANIHIVGMSATIGNLREICDFLNADVYTKNFRPVELTEYVKCGNEIARVNWQFKDVDDLLVDVKRVDYKYSEAVSKIDPDMLGGLVLEVVPKGSCLVFCASKKNCENVCFLLCKLAKQELKNYKKTEKDQLSHALRDEGGELCNILKVSVQFGIAYHHSGLTSDERKLIEEGFRAGTLSVICCTSTLAAGVNLPARRVVLRAPYVGRDFISLSRYKQMAGRAGRAGLGETGESIIVTQPADMVKVKNLLMSPMNQALSSLHLADGIGLRHLLLSCISLGVATTRSELQNVAARTLMAVQAGKLEVNVKKMTDVIIKNLFKLGALQEATSDSTGGPLGDMTVKMDTSTVDLEVTRASSEGSDGGAKKKKKTVVISNNSRLMVSNLGSAAIRGGLELSRAHQLYEDLYQAQASLVLLDCLHLLYLVTPYETAEQIKPNMQVYYEVLSRLNPKEMHTAKVLGLNEATIVKMLSNVPIKNVPERVLNRFYLTLVLYDLWREKPVFEVAEKFQINRGTVQNLMTVSATFASNVVNFCEQLEEFWAFAYLLKGMCQRLSHCCIKELLPLMELPAVKQSRAKQLYNAGYKTLQSVAKANVNDLVENIEFMSKKIAGQLIAASKMLLLEKVENLREEAEDVLDGVENPHQVFNSTVG